MGLGEKYRILTFLLSSKNLSGPFLIPNKPSFFPISGYNKRNKAGEHMTVKEFVLKELEIHRDQYLSGEELAEKKGVTRASVWKAIKELQKEGYEIQSHRKRGYLLSPNNDLLSSQGIASYLKGDLKDLRILSYKTIDSTNEEGKRLLTENTPPFLVVSEEQTKGKGRLGRSFYSPKETGIYMTFVYPFNEGLEKALSITTIASVAVAQVLEKLSGKEIGIKWVNDLYLEDKKIAGILTEAITSLETSKIETVLVGIGINIHTVDFPKDLEKIASSLHEDLIRNQCIGEIVNTFTELLDNPSNYLDYYRKRHILQGKEVYYIQGQKKEKARVIGINDLGALLLDKDGETLTLHSGEVTLRKV